MKDKNSLINNAKGANMLNGIINALALQINPFKKYDYSVIETDEAFLEKVYSKTKSDYLLVTNLFEDQTDRFSSPFYTKTLIQNGIDKQADVQLILNSDEPISASLKSNKPPIYYGVRNVYDINGNKIEYEQKTFECPICKNSMEYSKNFYSHQGHYRCSCGFTRQLPKYNADVKLTPFVSSINPFKNEIIDIIMKIVTATNIIPLIFVPIHITTTGAKAVLGKALKTTKKGEKIFCKQG